MCKESLMLSQKILTIYPAALFVSFKKNQKNSMERKINYIQKSISVKTISSKY